MLINLQAVDPSTRCGSIHKLWINPQYVDHFTIRGSIHNMWTNPQYVDQSTILGSIHNLWTSPQYVNQSTIFGSFHDLWINPLSLDTTTISGYNHNVWIIQQLWIHLKVFQQLPTYINSPSVDKSTAFHTQLRNPHFLMCSFPLNLPHFYENLPRALIGGVVILKNENLASQ